MHEDEARRRLDEAEQEARRAIQNLIESGLGMSLKQSVQALSGYDNHPADSGTETFERELDDSLRTARLKRPGAIEAARQRLDQGAFGTCGRCGAANAGARLQAVPWAVLCLRCQEGLDGDADGLAHTSRAAGEGIISMPYGQGPQARRNPVGFDGQDTWQALARYGTANGPQDAGRGRPCACVRQVR